jgi:hypothetical protein
MTPQEYAAAYAVALKKKLDRMRNGERVILSDRELDALLTMEGDAYHVRTVPNPKRLGMLDTYIGWL